MTKVNQTESKTSEILKNCKELLKVGTKLLTKRLRMVRICFRNIIGRLALGQLIGN